MDVDETAMTTSRKRRLRDDDDDDVVGGDQHDDGDVDDVDDDDADASVVVGGVSVRMMPMVSVSKKIRSDNLRDVMFQVRVAFLGARRSGWNSA